MIKLMFDIKRARKTEFAFPTFGGGIGPMKAVLKVIVDFHQYWEESAQVLLAIQS